MQFIVFAAFAIVLSVPEAGAPWATIRSHGWMWGAVIGQVVLAGLVGGFYTRLVKVKLEREPAWLPSAQRRLAQGNAVIRGLLLAGFGVSVYLTDWVRYVRGLESVQPIWGLDEVIILIPFFVAMVSAWGALYPADRAVRQVALELRLWACEPSRAVWGLGGYLGFMIRQHVLIIAVPMVPIVVANDFILRYGPEIRGAVWGLAWAPEALLVLIAGLIFLMAPVMLCHIWQTRVLPPGELRDRLEGICKREGLRYRQILIWESAGMMVNAAVMGIFKPIRYILLSDGLLEMMEDQKIEAVFGHEAGHVKLRHIQYYLLFAVLSMLIVGGVGELAMLYWDMLFSDIQYARDYLQVAAMALIIIVWALGFGVVSRRFEWEADLFGARSVTPEADKCDQPCFVHGTATDPLAEIAGRSDPLCATAATVFAEALHRIAVLNGIPTEARSWRHSSIANRIMLLKKYAHDPMASLELKRSARRIKAVLLLGTILGLGIAVWLYWPG